MGRAIEAVRHHPDMPLPLIADAADARQAVVEVLAEPRLRSLIDAFRPGPALDAVATYVRGVRADLPAHEAEHVDRVLKSWSQLEVPPAQDPLADAVSGARAWDVRCGRERDSIPRSVDLYPPHIGALVFSLAEDWGMTRPPEVRGSFDAVVPIGGLVRANLTRPATAAALLADGTLTAPLVIGLTGDRTTSPQETQLARELRAPDTTEQDAMRAGLERSFGLTSNAWEAREGGPGDLHSNTSGSVPVLLGVAPRDPVTGRRVNTGQAFAWLLALHVLPAAAAVVQVTTSIYWIANQIDLRTAAPSTMSVTTTGALDRVQAGPAQVFRSQHYLQELKSAVDALPRLQKWAGP